MVRVPATANVSSSTLVIFELSKVISGYSSTSKKSDERRWPSRFSFLVSMLAASIVTPGGGP
jgi:hypothetical protein